MKIAYIIYHDIKRNDGVVKKVKSQTDTWRQMGHNCQVFCFMPSKGSSILKAKQFESKNYIKSRVLLNTRFINEIESFNPEIVYFRYDSVNVSLIKVLKSFKSIAELNTLDLEEYNLLMKEEKTLKAVLRFLVYFLGRSMILKNVVGLVGVTSELIQNENYSKYCKSAVMIPNTINLKEYNICKQKLENERTALFFIGTPNQPWQGADIVARWAENMPEYDFHVVGFDGVNNQNLFYYGYLSQSEYVEILKKCHICIGTLAGFRKNIKEASPLKVREYLAYGFPTIIGYIDSSFEINEPSFLFRLKESELFNYSLIRTFVENNKHNVVLHEALHTIDSNFVESKRLEFFEDCLAK